MQHRRSTQHRTQFLAAARRTAALLIMGQGALGLLGTGGRSRGLAPFDGHCA